MCARDGRVGEWRDCACMRRTYLMPHGLRRDVEPAHDAPCLGKRQMVVGAGAAIAVVVVVAAARITTHDASRPDTDRQRESVCVKQHTRFGELTIRGMSCPTQCVNNTPPSPMSLPKRHDMARSCGWERSGRPPPLGGRCLDWGVDVWWVGAVARARACVAVNRHFVDMSRSV